MLNTYSKRQLQRFKPKVFCTVIDETPVYVKAYLKENAVRRLQEINPNVNHRRVHWAHGMNSHQATVDELIEVAENRWQIKYTHI